MSIICIAKGTATIGLTTRGADGADHKPDTGAVGA